MPTSGFFMPEVAIRERMMASNPHRVIDISATTVEGCSKFDGALIRAGEYVNYDNGLVGQIISLKEKRDVPRSELSSCSLSYRSEPMRELVLLRKISIYDGLEGRPCTIDYSHILPSLKEAIPTCELVWKSISCITNIAFLFHIDSIQDGTYQKCNGMVNAFFVRKHLEQPNEDGIQKSAQLTKGNFNPFFSPFGKTTESYSKRIWYGIASLNEHTWRGIQGEKATWGSRTKHVHFNGFNRECYCYVTDMLHLRVAKRKPEDPVPCGHFSFKRAKKTCNPDLSVSNKRMAYEVNLVRIQQENMLEELRCVLGSTFGVALTRDANTRKKIELDPHQYKETVPCHDIDEVRIVTCGTSDIDLEATKDIEPETPDVIEDDNGNVVGLANRLSSLPGVDLFFEECNSLTNLHVALKFKRLLGSSEICRKARNGGCIPAAAARDVGVITAVSPEDEFRYNNQCYEVVTNQPVNGMIKVRLVFDSEAPEEEMEVSEVIGLVRDSNKRRPSLTY